LRAKEFCIKAAGAKQSPRRLLVMGVSQRGRLFRTYLEAGRAHLSPRGGGAHSFQNGEAFINNGGQKDYGGQKGPQIEVLLPGTYRINLNLFDIQIAPAAVVEANKIGLVTRWTGSRCRSGNTWPPPSRATTITRTARRF
jgi:hypothetical protein